MCSFFVVIFLSAAEIINSKLKYMYVLKRLCHFTGLLYFSSVPKTHCASFEEWLDFTRMEHLNFHSSVARHIVKHGVEWSGLDWSGFVKYGFAKGGFVKGGFV